MMHIGVPAETRANETRVAATPETVKKYVSQGHRVTVQSGAGIGASYLDDAYATAGAELGGAMTGTMTGDPGARVGRCMFRRSGSVSFAAPLQVQFSGTVSRSMTARVCGRT